MKRPPSSAGASRSAPAAAEAAWLKALAATAFVLMAAAMTVRPILGEMWTVQVTELISPSPLWWNTSPAVMYISHVTAAVGLLLGALWVALKRRRWRFTGLEPAVLLLVLAALICVPAASDKRLAINVAIGTVLPIAVAAVLIQMLACRDVWRRALLAAILAAAVANCWRSTRQQVWEYEETWQHYVQNKAQYWAKQGKSLDDPTIAIFESRIKANQPSGYFYHPNVMASFLLLGIAAAAAGMGTGLSLRRSRVPASEDSTRTTQHSGLSTQDSGLRIPWPAVSVVALAAIILWQLIVIYWVGSVGAKAGIAFGIVAGLLVWRFGKRPWTAALLCAAMLAGLQIGLTVLAARADSIVPALAQRGGKLKSLAFRLDYWHGALEIFSQHPITGIGPGQFGQAYPSVKPIRAAEEVAHCHNWLLNVAAEWGVVGLVGTLAALVLPVWVWLRRRQGRSPDVDGAKPAQISLEALLLAWAIVFLCWLIFLPGVVPAGSAVFQVETLPALPMALACAALAAMPAVSGLAPIFLLAGLVAFFVHGTVEMASGVAAAAWPFWATLALVLSSTRTQSGIVPEGALSSRQPLLRPAFTLAGLASLAVLILSVNPMRAIWSMSQAKNAFESPNAIYAEQPLREAAAADPLDPAPRAALAEFYRRMAAANRNQAGAYLRQAIESARAAVRVNPASHTLLHDLAWTAAQYAATTKDPAAAQEAVATMRSAVGIYPNWPRGHIQLAMLLAGAGEPPHNRPDLLREALAEIDAALRLDEQWPSEDPNKLDAKGLADLRARRDRVARILQSAPSSRPTAAPLD
jgi:tetratricopeptide (TPR) repeat protein